MRGATSDHVRAFIADFLNGKLKEQGKSPLNNLPDDYDLWQMGPLDSLSLVEMLTAIGEHFTVEIDFEGLDPEKMTVVGPLCMFVLEQLRKRS